MKFLGTHPTVRLMALVRMIMICLPLQFIEKAPEDVVCGVREKAAEAEEKINLTKNRLSFLRSSVSASQ